MVTLPYTNRSISLIPFTSTWNVMIQFTITHVCVVLCLLFGSLFQSREEKEILGAIGAQMPPSLSKTSSFWRPPSSSPNLCGSSLYYADAWFTMRLLYRRPTLLQHASTRTLSWRTLGRSCCGLDNNGGHDCRFVLLESAKEW